jgi:sporulation protein YlmC with PRC-barrel domain
MSRKQSLIGVLSIVGLLGASVAFAQGPATTPSSPREQAPAVEPAEPVVPKATTFIGSSVENPQGESLGKIHDLMIDPETGRITYAALSYGSVLGLGGKLFAVSWEALEVMPDGKTFVLNVSKETLETSPGFDKNDWPQEPDPMLSAAAGEPAAPTSSEQAGTQMGNAQPAEALSGTVQEVNAQGETFTLETAEGKTVDLQAPAELLTGLQVGDAVEVSRSGNQAIAIHKQEGSQQSSMGEKPKSQ